MSDIISKFPIVGNITKPRKTQEAVLKEVERLFSEGKRFVIVEAPVGSGKSAMALAVGRYGKDAHILTPRKSLQDQYWDDFNEYLVLMKGRSSYPCLINQPHAVWKKVNSVIATGVSTMLGEDRCDTGVCLTNRSGKTYCTKLQDQFNEVCPYTKAIGVAQASPIVVHNLHSYMFQTAYSGNFDQREYMIVDEAHEIESIIRDFITTEITVSRLRHEQFPELQAGCSGIKEWCLALMKEDLVPVESGWETQKKQTSPGFESVRDQYLNKLTRLMEMEDSFSSGITVRHELLYKKNKHEDGVLIKIVPHYIGHGANNYLFSGGRKVLLMSGTIYDHHVFCKALGIPLDQTACVKIPSSFPVQNRPIYCKEKYQVDTSFAAWDENFDEMITKIQAIMSVYSDAKGLIHAPSYKAARDIEVALKSGRVKGHDQMNFSSRLSEFYASESPDVFISPICQQGVDFKGDRARFQIIIRVPYLNSSDPFIAQKMAKDFPWYNLQALIIFGQQIGRINRSEDDYGATFLLDSRFNTFLSRNWMKLPKWLKDAIIK